MGYGKAAARRCPVTGAASSKGASAFETLARLSQQPPRLPRSLPDGGSPGTTQTREPYSGQVVTQQVEDLLGRRYGEQAIRGHQPDAGATVEEVLDAGRAFVGHSEDQLGQGRVQARCDRGDQVGLGQTGGLDGVR